MERALWPQRLVLFVAFGLLCFVYLGAANSYDREDAFIGYSEKRYERTNFSVTNQESEYLIFSTELGEIKVELATMAAPETVHYLKSLVNQRLSDGCAFYRAEPAGPTFDKDPSLIRPGYALVQGGLYSCGRQETKKLPVEATLKNTKGAVSLITGTSEFFFNLEDHPDWDGNFSVFGKVVGSDSWITLSNIVSKPTRMETHESGTVLRILLDPVQFVTKLESSKF